MLLDIINHKLSYQGKKFIKIDTWSARASHYHHFDGTYKKRNDLKDGTI